MNQHSSFTAHFEAPATKEVLKISLGRSILPLPVVWLGGRPTEEIFPRAKPLGQAHGFQIHEAGNLLIGIASVPVNASPVGEATRDIYTRLLAATAGRSLYRIWNYVPAINASPNGVENYRAFCIGRSQVFEAAYGADFRRALPAASAVGSIGEKLTVVFVAGLEIPQHFENPEQVAAYNYPREHGERPPSFARATVSTHARRTLVFVSGTAAIKGHVTVAPDSLDAQLDCTIDNLNLIGRAAGLGHRLSAHSGATRHFKIYLRDAADYGKVRDRLETELLQPEDQAIYLQADICRAALKLEIEATLIG